MESSASTIDQKVQQTLDRLEPQLKRTDSDPRPVVLMTCAVAGAGKSTLSRALLARHPNFTRLSIDNIIATHHGLYGTDYPPSLYSTYQDEAAALFRSELIALLEAGERDVVLDRAFYAKSDREEFKRLVERGGGRWVLVFLKVGREELWRRIEGRKMGVKGPDSAREIGWEVLGEFVEGFEVPVGEGEVVVDN